MMHPVRNHILLVVAALSFLMLGQLPSSSLVRAQQLPSESMATPLPPAFVDRCLEVAEQLDAQFAAELRLLCELDPVEFERIIRRQGPRLTGLAELKLADPGLFQKKLIELKADAEVQRLTIELRRAMAQSPQEPARIESLQQLLRGQLRIRLGFELHNQQLYIERIEEQLKSLRARTAWEREHFDTVVEQELARLTGSADPIQAARE
ncbi:MAG: hypothetical protein MK095_04585 [Phycisphaerales bacterium]|nr:hypothetical protein [Phycisphaerales bacterium]